MSGVITNFIQDENEVLVKFVKDTQVPFVILGDHPDHSLCRVYRDETCLHDRLASFVADRGFKRSIQVEMSASGNDWRYLEHLLSEYRLREITENQFSSTDPDIIFGVSQLLLSRFAEEKDIPKQKLFLYDDSRIQTEFRPALLVKSTVGQTGVTAVELLFEWIDGGSRPEPKYRTVSYQDDDFQVII